MKIPALLLLALPVFNAFADNNNPQVNTTKFETILGGTRLIYNLSSSGAAISIKNPQNYPILVQSKVVNPDEIVNQDMVTDDNFIVTPPLFRLDGLRQTSLKVVRVGGNLPDNRESLRYLCVKGIPPKEDDAWAISKDSKKYERANLNLNIAVQTCIKLLIRPEGLSDNQVEAAHQVNWYQKDGSLIADNKSALYIQPEYIKVNGNTVKSINYLKPFSTTKFTLNLAGKKIEKVDWAYIDSDGAVSNQITSAVK